MKIVKRGGSAEERARARARADRRGLTLCGPRPRRAGKVEVSYEVKVPRGAARMEMTPPEGDVKISGFDGAVVTNVKKGNAEFLDGAV